MKRSVEEGSKIDVNTTGYKGQVTVNVFQSPFLQQSLV